MTYEQAKEKALKINPEFNACKEYKIAYYFYDKHDKTFREPGNDVVVLKETQRLKINIYVKQNTRKGVASRHALSC